MKKRLYRLLLWGMTLLLMAAIFGFSSQTGPESGRVSAVITVPVTEALAARQPQMSPEEKDALYFRVDHLVRKTAHFCEYALLGLLLCLLVRSYGLNSRWLPAGVGVTYAATDEIHQLFMPQRAAMFRDVLLDGAGVLCGVLCIELLVYFRRKKQC